MSKKMQATKAPPSKKPSDVDEKLLLRPASVALALDITPRTLRRWISVGTFPPADLVIGGKLRFWRRETVTHWIEQNSRAGNPDLES